MIEVPEPAGAAGTETAGTETRTAETRTEAEPGMADEAKAANPNRTARTFRTFRTIGTLDLFEYDPLHGRAGLGHKAFAGAGGLYKERHKTGDRA